MRALGADRLGPRLDDRDIAVGGHGTDDQVLGQAEPEAMTRSMTRSMTAQVTAGTVSPADVLGYITERGEAEIVLDAGHVRLLPEQGQAVTLSQ